MSKYTVELRYLIDEDFDIGLDDYPIFDEDYRDALNTKIINHYMYREIGFETPALFAHYMAITMDEIMPLYNQYYESALITFDPMESYKVSETSSKTTTGSGTSTATGSVDSTVTTDDSVVTNADHTDDIFEVESDTPAGLISATNIKGNVYASKARRADNTIADDTTVSTDGSQVTATEQESSGSTTISNLDEYVHNVTGHMGGKNYSELLQDFRQTFLNTDLMIIKELENLFMGVY